MSEELLNEMTNDLDAQMHIGEAFEFIYIYISVLVEPLDSPEVINKLS